MLTTTHSGRLMTLTLAICLACVSVFAAPPSGGGGGKVSVTEANPPEATQGQELDVTITGSGFDSGSSVSYLVTGTTDASQVEVLSVQYISSTQLKTRIRPKENALTTDYDIEVRISTGRKGKGTTLFRVKAAETACTGDEPKEPTIAYVTGLDTSGDIWTGDLYLSSASACDQYLLVEDAAQLLPDNNQIPQDDRFIQWVDFLRFTVRGNTGVVTWIDGSQGRSDVMGLVFDFDSSGTITLRFRDPVALYSAAGDLRLRHQDVRIDENGDVELILLERSFDGTSRRVSTYNVSSGAQTTLMSGNCEVQGNEDCFVPSLYVFWGADGNEVIVEIANVFTANDKKGLASMRRVAGTWQQPKLLLATTTSFLPWDVSRAGLMLLWYEETIVNKRGKPTGWNRVAGVLDLLDCESLPCSIADTLPIPALSGMNRNYVWTSGGSILAYDGVNTGQNGFLEEYLYPFTTGEGRLIENVLNWLTYDASQ